MPVSDIIVEDLDARPLQSPLPRPLGAEDPIPLIYTSSQSRSNTASASASRSGSPTLQTLRRKRRRLNDGASQPSGDLCTASPNPVTSGTQPVSQESPDSPIVINDHDENELDPSTHNSYTVHPSKLNEKSPYTPSPIQPSVSPIPPPIPHLPTPPPPPAGQTPISEQACPICFCPIRKPVLTLCGHVMCGSCLWPALKSARDRAVAGAGNPNETRCPVCRAEIHGWDWRGGGVIALETKVLVSEV